ncbi:MAG: uncharacterized protein HW384_2173 [Dehalococcoidia bacterium]|nr:uncharacterized protein [Dehalococcoidia bacterium]
MAEVVLDASALLALLNQEPGSQVVAAALSRAAISAINLCEVVTKLANAGMLEATIRKVVGGLSLEIEPFDIDQTYEAGMLHTITKSLGLSLGDRGCLSLARRLNLPVLTADRTWAQLKVGVQIKVIR